MASSLSQENTPRPRRERGEGSVYYSQKRGYWICKVPCGIGPNGMLRYVSKFNLPTEKAAEKAR